MENLREKLLEQKKLDLLQQRQKIKDEYNEKNIEIKRQLQIYQTKNWKCKNPDALAAQKHRRYLWLKESARLRNILL